MIADRADDWTAGLAAVQVFALAVDLVVLQVVAFVGPPEFQAGSVEYLAVADPAFGADPVLVESQGSSGLQGSCFRSSIEQREFGEVQCSYYFDHSQRWYWGP